jgi:ABC-type multidrug transport system fused ATPase/permease subunit
LEALDRLMKGRTVIMITHRLNTIRGADQIIVLHGGTVAERGLHEELLALDGLYADLLWAKVEPAGSPLSRRAHPAVEAICRAV